jgi:hypothetical protein
MWTHLSYQTVRTAQLKFDPQTNAVSRQKVKAARSSLHSCQYFIKTETTTKNRLVLNLTNN